MPIQHSPQPTQTHTTAIPTLALVATCSKQLPEHWCSAAPLTRANYLVIEQVSTTSLATKLLLNRKMTLEVSLVNLMDVLRTVTDVVDLGLHLGVPKPEMDKIDQNFHTKDERKGKMLQWWLDDTLNPAWEKVITALRAMHKPVLADAVALVSKRESLYEPSREDLQKWEEALKTFDQKLQEVQQCSQGLEEEWEKGEKEWLEYLRKLQNIEED